MKRLSLHIGLNQIDPDVYGEGNDLVNCLNDCDYYTDVATENGFIPAILKDDEATGARVMAEISKASSALRSGDYFLVTYAGHGSQVPDEDDEEDDGMNETWVLYDRQMVDNEIYRMWSCFQPGVKIFVLSDSCHSGTLMRKAMIQVKPLIRKLSPLTRTFKAGYTKGARSAEPLNRENILTRIEKISEEKKAETDEREMAPEKDRLLSVEASLMNYVNNRDLYRTVMLLAGDKRDISLNASLLYISGCQDNQTSGDGPAGTNGVFTGKLKQTWNDGNFTGSYFDLYKRICALMPPVQSPNYMKLGVTDTAYETEKPFGSFKEGEAMIPQPEPETKSKQDPQPSEPDGEPSATISGSVGPGGANKYQDVKTIQNLLNSIPKDEGGPSTRLSLDGKFGKNTGNAIKIFQMFYGFDSGDDYGLVLPGSDTFSELIWQTSRSAASI